MGLRELRERAGYESCLREARNFNLRRKIDHWCGEGVIENTNSIRFAFPITQRRRHWSITRDKSGRIVDINPKE